MGILSNALGGLGAGLQNVGDTLFKTGMQEDLQSQRFQQQQQLQKLESDNALNRAKALEEFKLSLANQQRQQTTSDIQGVIASGVNKQFDNVQSAYQNGFTIDDQGNKVPIDANAIQPQLDADKQSLIAQQMQDPKAIEQAALASGHYDVAKGVDSLSKDNYMNVPFGGTVFDKDTGQAVYDGSAALKADIEQKKILASAMAKKAGQESLDKFTDNVHKVVKEDYGSKADPYALPSPDGKPKQDTAYTALLSNSTEAFAALYAQKTGTLPSTYDAINKVKPVLDQYDRVVRTTGEQIAGKLFSDNGKPKSDTLVDNFRKQGYDVQDKSSFLTSFRNASLTNDKFLAFAKDPQAGVKKFSDLTTSLFPPEKPQPQPRGIIDLMSNYQAPTAQDYRDQAANGY